MDPLASMYSSTTAGGVCFYESLLNSILWLLRGLWFFLDILCSSLGVCFSGSRCF